MVFEDRKEAGERLALEVQEVLNAGEVQRNDVVVLAIPRGGVVVAKIIADRLGGKLSLVVTKKIGAPGHEELAVGAMGPDGEIVWDEKLLANLGLSKEELGDQIQRAKLKIQDYMTKFKIGDLDFSAKTVVVVDDGIATGRTVEAAILYLKAKDKKVKSVVLAVPVAARDSLERLRTMVDKLVCLYAPEQFAAVGQFYRNFPQVSDEEVRQILAGRV